MRYASEGGVSDNNTHPFRFRFQEKDYIFAHNGTLKNYKQTLTLNGFQPNGETDSEHLFCYLLSKIIDRNISSWGNEDFLWFNEVLDKEVCPLGATNCIFSDGNLLFCYRDIKGRKRLNLTHRVSPYEIIDLIDVDFTINLSEVKDDDEEGYIIATEPLTNPETWDEFEHGELMVFKEGRIVFSSNNKHMP